MSFCGGWKHGGRNFRAAVVNYDAIISIVMITVILGRFEYDTCNIEPHVGEHAIVRASVGSSRFACALGQQSPIPINASQSINACAA